MLPAQNDPQEAARLNALQSYAILDTPAEEAFDQLAILAARICNTPMAMINFLDSERLWFKAAVGLPLRQTGRSMAFCSHALSGSRDPLVVADARQHPLFADNPLVTGEPHVRLYACVPLVTAEGAALGTLAVLDTVPRPLTDEQLAGLKMLAGQVMVLLELRRQQRQLSQLEQECSQLHAAELQYRMLFDEHPHPMWVCTQGNLRLLAVNRAMVSHYGYTEAELLQLELPALYAPEDRPGLKDRLQDMFHLPRDTSVVHRHVRKDGTLMQMEISGGSISFNGVAARQVLAIDVTERLRTEDDLRRMGRTQRLLSACNEALVRATSETTLLQAICQIAVDIGGYRMGWVGFAQNDERKSIQPVAHAGYNQNYIENLQLSWSADDPCGQGPAGMAMRSGKPVIVQDIRAEDNLADWTKHMLDHGFHGVICLPLQSRGRTFGLLYLYAPEILHISADEAKLLQQLANDLAFGIMSLRARKAQQRLQASVLKMAAACQHGHRILCAAGQQHGRGPGRAGGLRDPPAAATARAGAAGDDPGGGAGRQATAQQRIHAGRHTQPAAAQPAPGGGAGQRGATISRGAHGAPDRSARLCRPAAVRRRRRGDGHDLRAVSPADGPP